jgi:hypothetical protein
MSWERSAFASRRCYVHVVRWATLVLLSLVACSDLREFRGTWGGRLNENVFVQSGIPDAATGTTATLSIDVVNSHELAGRLMVPGLFAEAPIATLPQAEADVLSDITFAGAPLKVYLAFAAAADGGGDALVVVALYDDRRVEVRVLRGEPRPLYGIFSLTGFTP